MNLNEKANQPFKQNRNVGYENPPKTMAHLSGYHYASGNGSISSIQDEKESKTLIDQPTNTRAYHYPSGDGKEETNPIRKMNRYIVGGRVERNRATIDIASAQENNIRNYVKSRIIEDVPDTITGEKRDFVKDYTGDDNLAGSINNNGKPPKEYVRKIRGYSQSGKKVDPEGVKSEFGSERAYHSRVGNGKNPEFSPHVIGTLNSDEEKGYHYPSGKGEKSPIIGTVLACRPSRGTGSNGQSKFDGKMKGSLKVGSESIPSYSERGSCSDCER